MKQPAKSTTAAHSRIKRYRWQGLIKAHTNSVALSGYATIAILVATFGVWASSAPLTGAAVAPGFVSAAGRNIEIQHLEGGIISELLVAESDRVSVGQTLVVLDDTLARAQFRRIKKQILALEAKVARLAAERDGRASISYPEWENLDEDAEWFEAVLAEQNKEFNARLARFDAETEILRQRRAALEEAVIGLTAQKEASQQQLEVVHDELVRKKKLLDQGLTNRSEYTALLRSEAELIGNVGSVEAQIASSNIKVVETRHEVERLATARVEQAVAELNSVRTSIADLEEQQRSAESVLTRTVIKSPVDGIVVRTIFNVRGGVIRAGEVIAELLPTSEQPIIEARVSPRDVDVVHVGQQARLRFSALNARVTPEVTGAVTYISADRLLDEKTGEAYFTARVRIADELPSEISREQIYPGMPVETFLSTGERTFLQYLMRPMLDSFNRAFREE